MSLATIIDTHDEGALAALASVGLVRRATRDLDKDKAEVVSRDDATATVMADGQTVTIHGKTLTDATCTCPATGVCRHIVLAVLALRADLPEDSHEDQTPAKSAREDLTALTEAELRKFAGADWDKALMQARMSAEGSFAEDRANITVRLPDTEFAVTFLPGLSLKDAVYKGPKTTKRRVVTAAALLVRMQTGTQKLDDLTVDSDEAEPLSVAFLQELRAGVEALVAGVFGGGSVIAEEAVFDMAISARAQAAPRLTGLLRNLAKQARLARDYHFTYTDTAFISLAATTTALSHALEADALNPKLTGVLRRNYADQPEITLIPMGAVKWTAATGARGMRIHLWAPDEQRWYTTGQARGAGMDPGFTPQTVYSAPLWVAGPAQTLMGKSMRLQGGRSTADGQIKMDEGRADSLGAADLTDSGALFTDFMAARNDLAGRIPTGLGQEGHSAPLLLLPHSLGEASFDDIAQVFRVPATGACDTVLDLILSKETETQWLLAQKSRLRGILCEASFTDLELSVRPVSVHLAPGKDGTVNVCNLTLDRTRETGGLNFKAWAKSLLKATRSAAPVSMVDPIHDVSLNMLDATAEALRFGDRAVLDKPLKQLETLGLKTLHNATSRFAETGHVSDGLRVSYIAAELARISTLRR